MWVAGGNDENNAHLKYSTDGKDWTNGTGIPFGTGECKTIAYKNNMWVAGGIDPNFSPMWYSTNGKSWTAGTGSTRFAISGIDCNTVTFAYDNIWVAGGDDGGTGTGNLWYSTDGIVWVLGTGDLFNTDGEYNILFYVEY